MSGSISYIPLEPAFLRSTRRYSRYDTYGIPFVTLQKKKELPPPRTGTVVRVVPTSLGPGIHVFSVWRGYSSYHGVKREGDILISHFKSEKMFLGNVNINIVLMDESRCVRRNNNVRIHIKLVRLIGHHGVILVLLSVDPGLCPRWLLTYYLPGIPRSGVCFFTGDPEINPQLLC